MFLVILFAVLEIIGMNAPRYIEDQEQRNFWHFTHDAFTTLALSFVIERLARAFHLAYNLEQTFTLWAISLLIVLLKVVNLIDELIGQNTTAAPMEWIGASLATIFVIYLIIENNKRK